MVFGQGGLSGILRGGILIDGLGIQRQPDGSSKRNIFEDSCTEKGTGEGNAIFEGGFKFASSEARKKFDITDSAVHR